MSDHFPDATKKVPRTPTPTIIKALTILARDIESQDGVATAALLEAAQRMGELVDYGNGVDSNLGCGCGQDGLCKVCRQASEQWTQVSS